MLRLMRTRKKPKNKEVYRLGLAPTGAFPFSFIILKEDCILEDYKPNSNVSKRKSENKNEIEHRVDKLDGIGNVKVKKKSSFKKFVGSFINEDAENVGTYLVRDILIPSLQKAFYEMITNGSEIMIFGSTGKKKTRSPGTYYSYNSIWDDRHDRDYDRDRERERSRISYDLDDIIFDNRNDAEEVLIAMDKIRERYDGIVTVLDLFDIVGKPARHTDNKYGWTSLKNAGVERVRDGYVLRLPRPMPID